MFYWASVAFNRSIFPQNSGPAGSKPLIRLNCLIFPAKPHTWAPKQTNKLTLTRHANTHSHLDCGQYSELVIDQYLSYRETRWSFELPHECSRQLESSWEMRHLSPNRPVSHWHLPISAQNQSLSLIHKRYLQSQVRRLWLNATELFCHCRRNHEPTR